MGPFLTKSRPKLKQGSWAWLLCFEGTRLGSSQLNDFFKNQVIHKARSYKKYMPKNKNILEQQKPKQKKERKPRV